VDRDNPTAVINGFAMIGIAAALLRLPSNLGFALMSANKASPPHVAWTASCCSLGDAKSPFIRYGATFAQIITRGLAAAPRAQATVRSLTTVAAVRRGPQ
jgi:hypothetical protein